MELYILTALVLFIAGLFFGSFFNVLIFRLPVEENPFKGRSHCDYCNKTLQWYDLIPVLSFLSLGGKCRYCHKKLSLTHPLRELFAGGLFVGTLFLFMQLKSVSLEIMLINPLLLIQFASLLGIFSCLYMLFVTDYHEQILPDELVLFLGISAFVYQITTGVNVRWLIISSVSSFLFFLLLYEITKRKGIGFGDVKLSAALGLFTPGILTIVTYYVAFLTGASISLILLISKKKKWGAKIAFGPFLILGSIVSFFYGELLFILYQRLLGIV